MQKTYKLKYKNNNEFAKSLEEWVLSIQDPPNETFILETILSNIPLLRELVNIVIFNDEFWEE